MPDVGRPCANQPGSQSARLDVTGRFFQVARVAVSPEEIGLVGCWQVIAVKRDRIP